MTPQPVPGAASGPNIPSRLPESSAGPAASGLTELTLAVVTGADAATVAPALYEADPEALQSLRRAAIEQRQSHRALLARHPDFDASSPPVDGRAGAGDPSWAQAVHAAASEEYLTGLIENLDFLLGARGLKLSADALEDLDLLRNRVRVTACFERRWHPGAEVAELGELARYRALEQNEQRLDAALFATERHAAQTTQARAARLLADGLEGRGSNPNVGAWLKAHRGASLYLLMDRVQRHYVEANDGEVDAMANIGLTARTLHHIGVEQRLGPRREALFEAAALIEDEHLQVDEAWRHALERVEAQGLARHRAGLAAVSLFSQDDAADASRMAAQVAALEELHRAVGDLSESLKVALADLKVWIETPHRNEHVDDALQETAQDLSLLDLHILAFDARHAALPEVDRADPLRSLRLFASAQTLHAALWPAADGPNAPEWSFASVVAAARDFTGVHTPRPDDAARAQSIANLFRAESLGGLLFDPEYLHR